MFTAAVAVSMLVHLTVLWCGQNMTIGGSERNSSPFQDTIEVSLTPANTPQVRKVVQQESRSRVVEKVADQPVSDPAVTETQDEREIPAIDDATEANTSGDYVTTETRNSSYQSSGTLDAGTRDRYLAALLTHIESHKFYPLPARRRGVQGSVEVHFTLDARGGISDLDVTGSNSLFVEAARAAVRNALPLPAAPSSDGFPLTVRFQMIFKLR